MLDKSIKHFGVVMVKNRPARINIKLPEGYRFVTYNKGDETHWADIEMSVGEFDNRDDALSYFSKEFKEDYEALEKRCLFIEDSGGEKVATTTAWKGTLAGDSASRLHWVAVKPEYQGLGLCKCLIQEALKVYDSLNENLSIYLTTQTWSYKAINIYLQYGFTPYDDGKSGKFKGSQDDYEINFHKAWSIINEKIDNYKKTR